MNYLTFIKKHSFGEVEKQLLIALLEDSNSSLELCQNIKETFKLELTLNQSESIRNSYFSEYSS